MLTHKLPPKSSQKLNRLELEKKLEKLDKQPSININHWVLQDEQKKAAPAPVNPPSTSALTATSSSSISSAVSPSLRPAALAPKTVSDQTPNTLTSDYLFNFHLALNELIQFIENRDHKEFAHLAWMADRFDRVQKGFSDENAHSSDTKALINELCMKTAYATCLVVRFDLGQNTWEEKKKKDELKHLTELVEQNLSLSKPWLQTSMSIALPYLMNWNLRETFLKSFSNPDAKDTEKIAQEKRVSYTKIVHHLKKMHQENFSIESSDTLNDGHDSCSSCSSCVLQ